MVPPAQAFDVDTWFEHLGLYQAYRFHQTVAVAVYKLTCQFTFKF